MGYGLALAGGGTRGAAHAGVLLALKEEKVLPDYIGGTSAGSIVAGCFASGMEPEDLCEVVRHLAVCGYEYLDPDLGGMARLIPQILSKRPISLSGLLKGKKLNRYFCSLTNKKNLENITYPLLIPAVDIKTGDTVCYTNIKRPFKETYRTKSSVSGLMNSFEGSIRFRDNGRLCDIMMASCSVPGVFRPMKIEEFCFVDGGVANNLPVDLMIMAGVEDVVAVDIGTEYEMPDDDNMFEILSHSYSLMSKNLKDCRSSGEILLLKPDITKKAGLLTFEHMEECMEQAYKYTKKNATRIRKKVERTSQRD